MTDTGEPTDGDFASYLERRSQRPGADEAAAQAGESAADQADTALPQAKPRRQTIEDVLVRGEEPTEEFLDDFIALENAAPIPDDEFERQAVEHPGADGDPRTPE